MHSQTVVLSDFPSSLRPLIQPVDDWQENCRLTRAFEARVGWGKLLVCSIDLDTNLAKRPPARQLKYSPLGCLNCNKFNPSEELPPEKIEWLFQPELTPNAQAKQ